MKEVIAILVVGVALPVWAQGQTTELPPNVISSVSPLPAPRGTSITLVGNLPSDTTFWLPPEKPGVLGRPLYDCVKNPPVGKDVTRLVLSPPTTTTTTSTTTPPTTTRTTTFTVLIPASLAIGEYTLCARYIAAGSLQWYNVPVLGDSGRLQVIDAPGGVALEVTSVPRVVYEDDGRYKFSVLGNGFSRAGIDNKVLFDGHTVPLCWDNDPACHDNAGVGRAIANSPHQLDLDLPEAFKDIYTGSKKVQIRIGDTEESSKDRAPTITLAHISKDAPLWIAAIVVGVMALLVIVLLGMNRSAHTVAGKSLSQLSTLLLDKSTDTYSLSRAQFYGWTGAAVFGYSYLTVAWTMLQGRLEFPPIPENLPGIIIASAATATIVEGISSTKPKGAGGERPSLADFISTGGMVVPDRLQFLIWTMVGLATFVALIVRSDPATVATLPAIPTNFLTLMGISSAGYLGARLVRKGGPVIDDILAKATSLSLELHGRYLSKNASFQIDAEDVTLDQIAPAGGSGERLPEVVAKDDTAQDQTMAKVLTLTIASPKPAWMTRKTDPLDDKRSHTLTIINPDGQKAEWNFALAGPTAVLSVKAGQLQPVNGTLTVTSNDNVVLDASGSRVEEGTPTFIWEGTGDAAPPTGDKITRTFKAKSTQDITVKVSDTKGLISTSSVKIVVT